jgi:hypothetical protein
VDPITPAFKGTWKMSRSVTVLFRRAPAVDKQIDATALEGYELFWPDGSSVTAGLNAFCQHGQRLLGLGKHMRGCSERFIQMVCSPKSHREADIERAPGFRVRRFYLERHGAVGRLHFMDGTPTTATFDLDHDEERVLHWIGLRELPDGEKQWMDIAAVGATAEAADAPMACASLTNH